MSKVGRSFKIIPDGVCTKIYYHTIGLPGAGLGYDREICCTVNGGIIESLLRLHAAPEGVPTPKLEEVFRVDIYGAEALDFKLIVPDSPVLDFPYYELVKA